MDTDIIREILESKPEFAEERFTVTTLTRKMRTVLRFVETCGHIAIITVRGRDDCVIMSLETYLLMTQYATDEKTLAERETALELLRQRKEKEAIKKNRRRSK